MVGDPAGNTMVVNTEWRVLRNNTVCKTKWLVNTDMFGKTEQLTTYSS